MNYAYDTTAESNSNFMRWASRRIAEEVESNERIEREAGTRDFIPGSNCNRPTHRLNQDEKTEIINKIDTMRGTGVSLKTSVQQCGIHQSTYFLWKRTFNLPAYQPHKLTPWK